MSKLCDRIYEKYYLVMPLPAPGMTLPSVRKAFRNCLAGLQRPVRQAFQPDSTATENQRVRLESLTYEPARSRLAKQLGHSVP